MTRDLHITVSIIEDDETIREGYAFLINNAKGFKIASTYPSFEDAAKKIANDDPDVLLLDVELPCISGIDALTWVASKPAAWASPTSDSCRHSSIRNLMHS